MTSREDREADKRKAELIERLARRDARDKAYNEYMSAKLDRICAAKRREAAP